MRFRVCQECCKGTQLTRGLKRRLIYVENKGGTFSKSAQTVYYRGRELAKTRGQGIREIGDRRGVWVSGVKRRSSNTHPAKPGVSIVIDDDAQAEYHAILSSPAAP